MRAISAIAILGITAVAANSHIPRQSSTNSSIPTPNIPSNCTEQCKGYLTVLSACDKEIAGAKNGSLAEGFDELEKISVKCACSTDKLNSIMSCAACTPTSFDTTEDKLPELLQEGLKACADAGMPVTGVSTPSKGVNSTSPTRVPDATSVAASSPSPSSLAQSPTLQSPSTNPPAQSPPASSGNGVQQLKVASGLLFVLAAIATLM